MHCTRKITNDIVWIGADSRRLSLFEGVYPAERGISYNSYLLLDEKTVLFDTVEQDVAPLFMSNLEHTLGTRTLDYIVVHHMEPDHSATLMDVLRRYPDAKVICNAKVQAMIKQFFGVALDAKIVGEGDTLSVGKHTLNFIFAPMVHWPEVMMTYDSLDGILFSADAFGTFGALNGAIFADEVNFERDYLDEARRYYCNIVGKCGAQVQAVLKKASALDIKMLAPLHGFVWRYDIGFFVEKYSLWSSYTPECRGVVIAYSSVYGNTELAANILACRLRERGAFTVMYDTSVTHHSHILAECFKYSHLVFAAPTYNGGIFSTMDSLLRELVAHNLQGRTVAFIDNGSWAATSAKQMRAILEPLKNTTFIDVTPVLKSALHAGQDSEIDVLADRIFATL